MTANEFADMTVGDALRAAGRILEASGATDTPLLDARVLLLHAANFRDVDLILKERLPLSEDQSRAFSNFVQRRAAAEPVAYITGVKEFWSLTFRVTPDVLVPRDDSECLVEAISHRFQSDDPHRILDLGVGSACLLCALLSEFPNARGVGVDRSEKAAAIARANIDTLGFGTRARILVGDWGEGLAGPFDIIVANPPYIRDGDDLPATVSAYEPAEALYGGPDGLDAYRAILGDLPRLTRAGSLIVFECGTDQSDALSEMVSTSFPNYEQAFINDLAGRRRGVLTVCGAFAKKD